MQNPANSWNSSGPFPGTFLDQHDSICKKDWDDMGFRALGQAKIHSPLWKSWHFCYKDCQALWWETARRCGGCHRAPPVPASLDLASDKAWNKELKKCPFIKFDDRFIGHHRAIIGYDWLFFVYLSRYFDWLTWIVGDTRRYWLTQPHKKNLRPQVTSAWRYAENMVEVVTGSHVCFRRQFKVGRETGLGTLANPKRVHPSDESIIPGKRRCAWLIPFHGCLAVGC